MSAVPPDVLRARAYLSAVAEPAHVRLWDLVRREGPVAAAAAVREGTAPAEVLRATTARARECDPDAALAAAERHGVRLVAPESDDWPHFALAALERTGRSRAREVAAGTDLTRYRTTGEPVPPLALWVKGPADVASLGARSVAVVGSRAATGYGAWHARTLGRDLASRGVTVVSGGAHGIDKAAHVGALEARGTTVLVSAGGLDRAYPAAHEGLFRQVAETGLLVAESPPGAEPRRGRFLTRNRLIAAFAAGVVVVEAQARSGALNSSTHGHRQDRTLMAFPGSVDSALSAGCHELLRDERKHAVLVRDVADVFEALAWSLEPDDPGPAARPRGAAVDRRRRALDGLDDLGRTVFDALPADRAMGTDELVVASGLPLGEVLRTVPALVLAGLVEEAPGGLRVR